MNTFELASRPPLRRIAQVVGWILFGAALLATGARTVKQYHAGGAYDVNHGGMTDFHNGAYYPALALRQGVSPYGDAFAKSYPVSRAAPAYSPSIIALHIPFTWLPQQSADVIYFALSLALLLFTLRICMTDSVEGRPSDTKEWIPVLFPWLAFAIVASRGGHTTLFNGYFTPLMVLGTTLAVQFPNRHPWIAAFGFLVASGKPNYGIPLAILMLARGNYRALSYGMLLAIVGGLLPAFWLAWHSSWHELFGSIAEGQHAHMVDPREIPVNTWTRIDMTGVLSKWFRVDPSEFKQLLAMLAWIALPSLFLAWRARLGDNEGVTTLSGLITLLAVQFTFYHHVYDGLILIGPLAALCLSVDFCQRWPLLLRATFGLLITTSWWNYGSSEIVLNLLQPSQSMVLVLTSMGALSLIMAFVWVSFYVPQRTNRS